ncbi:right-handed parallel beta-helix repeat-containing protein [Halorubrum halophilum]|uniref:right-handed parallel beta-helix repeat-containing protein n=1 Tax=Halorubrum halophilum TaxID=413816 RepID=UPI0006794EB4|nr:right-handed parallel beta-helix repeat-containing protein [Halorubrum halophilum]
MERRNLLKAAGAVGITSFLAGCSLFDSGSDRTETSQSETTPSRLSGSEFETVVKLEDVSADIEGDEPIDTAIDSHLTDGTLVTVPGGRHRIGSITKRDMSNVGLVAADGATPTLVPDRPVSELTDDELLVNIRGSDILFGGFDLDFTRGSDYGGRVQLIAESGDVSVFDVTTKGQLAGNVDGYRVEAHSVDGVATVDNVNMRDGAVEGQSATGIFVGPSHAGEIHIRNCDIWHFPSKGIYASNPAHPDVGEGGTVHVEGGLYKNNNDCDVRVGSAGSTVKNIVSVKQDTRQGETVTWENPIPRRHWDGRSNVIQTRSIRLKHGQDVLIEGCEFVHDIGQGAGAITGESTHGGGTTIRDCRISVNDAEIYPILLKDGSGDGFEIENVTITGTGGRGAAIRVENGRDATTIRNCRIETESGDGIQMEPGSGITMAATEVSVPGECITIDDADRSLSELPYTIELERVDDGPGELSLLVTGDLQSLGTLSNVSLSPSSVGTQVIGTMDDATVRFEFSGDIRRLSADSSVVVSIET